MRFMRANLLIRNVAQSQGLIPSSNKRRRRTVRSEVGVLLLLGKR